MRTHYITQRPRIRGMDERGDDAQTSERARENRGRGRIYIVQIYSRLGFGSLPILFSWAKAGSHCARANFVTDYRAVLVSVGGDDGGGAGARPLLHADSLRSFSFSLPRKYARESCAASFGGSIDPFTRSAIARAITSLIFFQ